jgi:hypothetical protein
MRQLHVYPKVGLVGSTWTLRVKVYEPAIGVSSLFIHDIPAGITATTPLRELKLSFDLTVDDTDTDQDVDDALFLDDIKPGPQSATVWSNWQDRAEAIIAGLADPYTIADYWAAWSQQDTAKTRQDARRALVTQRGWAVTSVHQHEGDGTNTDESA